MVSLRGRGVGVPTRLRATAVTLAAVVVAELGARATMVDGVGAFVRSGEVLVGVLTSLPFIAGIAYAAHWLGDSGVDAERHRRVWWWTGVGATVSVLLNVSLMAVLPVESVLFAVGWLRWAVAVGAGVGVLVGVTEARAIQHATDVERAVVRAEHLERQRDLLDYLNSLLRHEVLNASNVISGYAALLREEHDDGTEPHEYATTVEQRSEEIATVIRDVRVLLHATDETARLEAVDVGEVLTEELSALADDTAADVESSLPENAEVWADSLLSRAFGNLLRNAVEHNDDDDSPRVSVDVRETGDVVVVDVEDDGPGVSGDTLESLFERPARRTADHRLGLYLVDRLVTRYGGEVELAETGPEGSTFRVTLPAADGDDPPMATSASFAPPRESEFA